MHLNTDTGSWSYLMFQLKKYLILINIEGEKDVSHEEDKRSSLSPGKSRTPKKLKRMNDGNKIK